eukprot:5565948-Amphidinium_carterae.2
MALESLKCPTPIVERNGAHGLGGSASIRSPSKRQAAATICCTWSPLRLVYVALCVAFSSKCRSSAEGAVIHGLQERVHRVNPESPSPLHKMYKQFNSCKNNSPNQGA